MKFLNSALTACALVTGLASAAAVELFEQPPFSYSATVPRDATVALQARIAAHQLKFAGSDREVLLQLLQELAVPVESQVLVFSKTSLQRRLIRPDHPRALFFSDETYVGWVPGGLIEVAAVDPVIGPVFYAVDPASLRSAAAAFARESDCLSCHGGPFVPGIPALFTRSVSAADDGELQLQFGSEVVDFRTPFANRWGGWYVTGTGGAALHRGNTIVGAERSAHVADLSAFFRVMDYPASTSDVVALLVLEHQTAMQNTITRASLNARRMLEYQRNLQLDRHEPVTDDIELDSVKSVFRSLVEELTDDLLFRGEAQLPEGVVGSPAFPQAFGRDVPRTADGSSLKDLSLDGRIFENRCSYLIYSDSFQQLPVQLKRRVYERLAQVLQADSPDPRYDYLGAAERMRIVRILRETLPEMGELLAPLRPSTDSPG